MKVMTILGTRPEIIRLSLIIPLLDRLAENQVLVHTGQNFYLQLKRCIL
jgi:UDP-N-acetylglucosamine 2-epimerase (non-hydrolysing)